MDSVFESLNNKIFNQKFCRNFAFFYLLICPLIFFLIVLIVSLIAFQMTITLVKNDNLPVFFSYTNLTNIVICSIGLLYSFLLFFFFFGCFRKDINFKFMLIFIILLYLTVWIIIMIQAGFNWSEYSSQSLLNKNGNYNQYLTKIESFKNEKVNKDFKNAQMKEIFDSNLNFLFAWSFVSMALVFISLCILLIK